MSLCKNYPEHHPHGIALIRIEPGGAVQTFSPTDTAKQVSTSSLED